MKLLDYPTGSNERDRLDYLMDGMHPMDDSPTPALDFLRLRTIQSSTVDKLGQIVVATPKDKHVEVANIENIEDQIDSIKNNSKLTDKEKEEKIKSAKSKLPANLFAGEMQMSPNIFAPNMLQENSI
jgi:hypothetical protein